MKQAIKPSLCLIILCSILLTIGSVNAFAQTTGELALDIAANDTCYFKDLNGLIKPVFDGEIGTILANKIDRIIKNKITSSPLTNNQIDIMARMVINGFSISNSELGKDPNDPACTPSESLTFCYDPVEVTQKTIGPPATYTAPERACRNTTVTKAEVLAASGWQKVINDALFRARIVGEDKICIEYYNGFDWVMMGCRLLPVIAEKDMETLVNKCFVGPSCYDTAAVNTKNILPFSSVVVQCFKETLYKVFAMEDDIECPERTNLFKLFQEHLRKAVTAALSLYVLFFGIKVVLGNQAPEDEEVFVFIVKLALVFYFAIGDGIQDHIYPAFMSAGESIAQIVFAAHGAEGLCAFEPGDYPATAMLESIAPLTAKSMALWDAFDCRVFYYLGIYNTGAIVPGATLAIFAAFTPPLFALIFPLLLGFQILPLIFLIIFAVFLISVGFFVIHTYIISLIVITLLLFVGPLFIPMVLFKVTKSYYDNWLRLLISFTIQPVVLFGFLGLMMSVVDTIYYKGCSFSPVNIGPFKMFKLTNAGRECVDSLGYKMDIIAQQIFKGEGSQSWDAFLFTFKILQPIGTGADMFEDLAKICVFLFFFYHIAGMLMNLCLELTGSIPLSGAISPTAIIDKAAKAAKNSIKAKIGAAAGKAEAKSGGANKAARRL